MVRDGWLVQLLEISFSDLCYTYEEKEGKEECVIGGYPSIAMDNTL